MKRVTFVIMEMLTASDEEIAAFAVTNGYAIISADSDFATMLALGGHPAPSLVLLRSVDRLTPEEQAELLRDGAIAEGSRRTYDWVGSVFVR